MGTATDVSCMMDEGQAKNELKATASIFLCCRVYAALCTSLLSPGTSTPGSCLYVQTPEKQHEKTENQ